MAHLTQVVVTILHPEDRVRDQPHGVIVIELHGVIVIELTPTDKLDLNRPWPERAAFATQEEWIDARTERWQEHQDRTERYIDEAVRLHLLDLNEEYEEEKENDPDLKPWDEESARDTYIYEATITGVNPPPGETNRA